MTIVKILKYIKIRTFPSNREKIAISWFKNNGDSTLRLDYDLTENSLVLDLGGYKGQWSSDIFAKYCCNIYIFEPVPAYSEKIRKRFEKNPRIKVFDYGLSNKTMNTKLIMNDDGSTIYNKRFNKRNIINISLIDIVTFLEQNDVNEIDLMKINIEGAEYDLLEYMIKKDLIKKVKNIQVQFHDFIPDSTKRMKKIQKKLERTHEITYKYDFVWENWRRK